MIGLFTTLGAQVTDAGYPSVPVYGFNGTDVLPPALPVYDPPSNDTPYGVPSPQLSPSEAPPYSPAYEPSPSPADMPSPSPFEAPSPSPSPSPSPAYVPSPSPSEAPQLRPGEAPPSSVMPAPAPAPSPTRQSQFSFYPPNYTYPPPPSRSAGLSTAAIVGIAVGAGGGALVVLAVLVVCLLRRRRRQQQSGLPTKDPAGTVTAPLSPAQQPPSAGGAEQWPTKSVLPEGGIDVGGGLLPASLLAADQERTSSTKVGATLQGSSGLSGLAGGLLAADKASFGSKYVTDVAAVTADRWTDSQASGAMPATTGTTGSGASSHGASHVPQRLRSDRTFDSLLAAAAGATGFNAGSGSMVTLAAVDLNMRLDDMVFPTDSLIGGGAFGEVHRVLLRGVQPVAVKLLAHGAAQAAHEVEAIRKEIAILSRVQHPRIVRCYGGCPNPPHMFIVEELMAGSLAGLLQPLGGARRALDLRTTLRLAIDVCEGLCCLHPAIVHRDLKPANILLTDATTGGRAKLADFGVSGTKQQTYLSTVHKEAGTVAYMAPECFGVNAERMVGERSDIYSLGIILWECLSGRRPWETIANHFAIAYQVADKGERPPLDQLPASCPPAMVELIRACWRSQARERPSAAEALAQLHSMLGDS